MKIDLKIKITENQYQVESTKTGYYKCDPALVMSIDNNNMECFLYIGESKDNIVSQKEYGEFLQKYSYQNPRFYNPFDEKSFSAEAAYHVVYYYFYNAIREKRKNIPEFFKDFAIGTIDRADVFIEFENDLNVPREMLEYLLRLLDESEFTKHIKIKSNPLGVLSN